jgi:prepilin-type N-terminal cleavage/methylation domain-containing protein
MKSKDNLIARTRGALKSKKGFTLIELLVTLTLVTLVLAMVYQFFGFTGKLFDHTDTIADQQDQARLMVQGLRKDLGTAGTLSLLSSGNPDSVGITGAQYAVYIKAGRLVRRDSSGNIQSVYSNVDIPLLSMEFSPDTGNSAVVHIVIRNDTEVLAETDVYSQNTDVDTAGLTDPDTGITSGFGNVLVYTPSS